MFVLVLLAALLPLTACTRAEKFDATNPGDVVQARAGVDTEGAAEGFLVVPSGRLDIRAGTPVESIDAEATTEREQRTAPTGGVFVPITWTFRSGGIEKLTRIFGRPQPIDMTLVSDGTSYPLSPPSVGRDGEAVDAYYLAVDGNGERLELELEYAGVTQTLDLVSGSQETGRAQGLYDLADAKYSEKLRDCPDGNWPGRDPLTEVRFTCQRADSLTVPFAQGEWAPGTSAFVAIELVTALTYYAVYAPPGGAASYSAVSSREKSKLDGKGPTWTLESAGTGGVNSSLPHFHGQG